jgi:hypothetical protein
VQITLADNGPGVPDNVRDRLFDPFFTTKPIGKGTGMGLSISYQVVTEKHGGTLVCDTTLGEGTAFIITIPLYQGAPPLTTWAAAIGRWTQGYREVLLSPQKTAIGQGQGVFIPHIAGKQHRRQVRKGGVVGGGAHHRAARDDLPQQSCRAQG